MHSLCLGGKNCCQNSVVHPKFSPEMEKFGFQHFWTSGLLEVESQTPPPQNMGKWVFRRLTLRKTLAEDHQPRIFLCLLYNVFTTFSPCLFHRFPVKYCTENY